MRNRYLPFIAAAAAAVPAACRSPLQTYDDEYGRIADPTALHEVDPLELEGKAAGDLEPADQDRHVERPDPFAGAERMAVSIEQCRAWTLQNNLDLKVALVDPKIAETAVAEEEAAFEAAFALVARASDADPGQAEVYRDQFVRPWDVEPAVRIPLRTGGSAVVAFPMSQRESFAGFPDTDQYAADLDLGIVQPLLRNAGRRTSTYQIRIAALGSQIAAARTKLEVIRQIANADRAYWLLFEAAGRLGVRQEQYERAIDQLGEANARFRGGVGPQIEVVRAEAGVSRRLESIIIAELREKDALRELKRIVNVADADVDSGVVFDLTSAPDPLRYALDPAELVAASLAKRMELLELELRLAQDYSTIQFAENQKLPLFTLDYTYRFHGAGSSVGEALTHDGAPSGWGWRVGVNLEVPIGNEAAESRLHRAILTRLQRLSTRSAREQAIKQEVLDALDNLEATWQRIQAARLTVETEALNYLAEQGQYRLGLRNSTEVLDAEGRLAEAKAAEITAVVDYQVAQVDLAYATGMLLGAAKVTW